MLPSKKNFYIFCVIAVLVTAGVFFYAVIRERFSVSAGAEETKQIPFVPAQLTWDLVASTTPWGARDSQAVAVFKDKIWVIGGLNANNTSHVPGRVPYEKAEYFNDIWASDDGIAWTRVLEHAPWVPMRSQTAIVFKDKLWLIGGWGPEAGYEKEIWASNDGVHWQSFQPAGGLPELEGQQMAVFRDRLWLTGGVRYTDRKIFSEVWSSGDGILWRREVARAPWFPRWDHAIADFNGELWLMGGMDLAGDEFNDIWKSADGVAWERVSEQAAWATRQGHVALVYENRLWIIGRLNDEFAKGENDIWYSADGRNWEKTNINPPWLGREDHGALVFRDAVWVLGGMTTDWNWSGDVWWSRGQ